MKSKKKKGQRKKPMPLIKQKLGGKLKKVFMTFSILAISFLLLTGFSGCPNNSQPDMIKCGLVQFDDHGNKLEILDWYWYCENLKSGDVYRINILETGKCIRDNKRECKWTGTDLREYKAGEKHYNEQCRKK